MPLADGIKLLEQNGFVCHRNQIGNITVPANGEGGETIMLALEAVHYARLTAEAGRTATGEWSWSVYLVADADGAVSRVYAEKVYYGL